jgi:hypothetical protein
MKNIIAVLGFIVVMMSIGCGDKVTNVTNIQNDTYMVNTYYSCVGEWVYSTNDTTSYTYWFYENKLWKSLFKKGTYAYSDSGSYLQDSRSIIITIAARSSAAEFIMIDSVTIVKMGDADIYKKK